MKAATKPLSSELLPRARALYLLHIIERPASHLTTAALRHTWSHKSSPRYNQWLLPTIRTLQRWGNDSFNADSYEITRCNLHRPETSQGADAPPIMGKAWAQQQAEYDIAYARLGHEGPRPIEHTLHTRKPETMPAPPITRSTHAPYTPSRTKNSARQPHSIAPTERPYTATYTTCSHSR